MADRDAQIGLVDVAIEPKFRAQGEKLLMGLAELAADDAALRVAVDRESGQIILSGASEAHLVARINALKQISNIDIRVGELQAAFRECVTQPAEVEYIHRTQSGGSSRFAAVRLRVEPNAPGIGNRFESRIAGDALPEKFMLGIERGIESVLAAGVVAGFPVVDVKTALLHARYEEDQQSSAQAFETAARSAFREALQKARSILLEPVMKVEIAAAKDLIDRIVGDLALRRAHLGDRAERGDAIVLDAKVPLINMFGYASSLHAMSEGRASFTMQFERYAPAPSPDAPGPFRPAMAMRA